MNHPVACVERRDDQPTAGLAKLPVTEYGSKFCCQNFVVMLPHDEASHSLPEPAMRARRWENNRTSVPVESQNLAAGQTHAQGHSNNSPGRCSGDQVEVVGNRPARHPL